MSFDDTDIISYNAFLITFTIEDDVLEGTTFTIEIKTKITDYSEKELENYTLSVELESKEIIVTMEDVVYATEVTMVSALSVSALSAVTSAGGASAGGSGSVAISSPATFWGFVEVLQIINYMVYLAVDNPYILKELFRKLAIVNGDFMPDLFGYFVEGTGVNPPSRFTEEGLSSNIFLNAGSFI